MKRAYPLQTSLRDRLAQDFMKFRDSEGLTDAEATRQLLTLALRIKLNDADDTRPSNRELMEEMYRRIRLVQGTSNLIHTQNYDGVGFHKNKNDAKEMRDLVSADVNNKVDAYLAGEKKE